MAEPSVQQEGLAPIDEAPGQTLESRQEWTEVIEPPSGWLDVPVQQLWRYRDLIGLFIRRDFVAVYKQTVLGPLWFFLQPLMTTLVFTVVFGRVAKVPTDGSPPFLFYLSGVVAWGYFSACLNKTSTTFISNAHIFGKVYFPRLAVPISVVLSNLMAFAIQFALFVGFLIYYFVLGAEVRPTVYVLLTPVLLVEMALLGLGCGIIVSSLTTRYRDLTKLVSFGTQLWMYATPIVYPVSALPQEWRWVAWANPMAPVVEIFRFAFLGSGELPFGAMILSFATTLMTLVVGLLLFTRVEKNFVDTI